MCGIAGIAGPHDEAQLRSLAAALAHRGPDDEGIHHDPEAGIGFAFRRLSIIDLDGGAQPMENDDGSLVLVFNGEIYNAPELRARLERDGVRFRSSHADTEVVLRLYERLGAECLDALNGMFAFVIHDRRRGVLFGARDRIGIKPLYLARIGGNLAFASELRALLRLPEVEREIDRESLFHFLSLRFVPGPRTILRGVERLPPGHRFEYDLARRELRIERWWRLRFHPRRDVAAEEWPERVRAALGEAVNRWTLADVPVAVSLSGGLDSSAVLALLAEGGASVRAHSLGFADGGEEELPLARALAARHGADLHEAVIRPEELLGDLPAMVWALDEPYGGGLPSWFVFRFMAADVKVGLTGTGGDELFGNYRRFVPFEQGRLARVPGRRGSVRRYHFEPSYYFPDGEKRRILVDGRTPDTSEFLQRVFDESGSASARDSVLYLDLSTQLPDEFLQMTDRFSMAHSLEARTPFLDHELVELVASIPPELRTDAGDPKGLLRKAIGDLLTPAHLAAPKRTFVFPLASWLRGELRPLAERLLSNEHLHRQGIFRPVLRERYLEPHLAGRADESERLWPLVMFQLWHLLYVEEGLTEPPAFSLRDLEAAA